MAELPAGIHDPFAAVEHRDGERRKSRRSFDVFGSLVASSRGMYSLRSRSASTASARKLVSSIAREREAQLSLEVRAPPADGVVEDRRSRAVLGARSWKRLTISADSGGLVMKP